MNIESGVFIRELCREDIRYVVVVFGSLKFKASYVDIELGFRRFFCGGRWEG